MEVNISSAYYEEESYVSLTNSWSYVVGMATVDTTSHAHIMGLVAAS
jgi:hypothetical protein